jgi:class 3 adenylate cyclase/tetratricopeptide (TPR) repeat protein
MTPQPGSLSPAGASQERALCPACGEANPERARFCLFCGAAIAEPAQAREIRKTVTTLFCDIVESSVLGEQADPELVRRVLFRFFDEMRAVIERHGGTVEKFIGDEVMAVFGVPVTHEDDAVRAVRAAAEMRARLRQLNEEFEREAGVSLVTRMGINTGEVVAGDPASGHAFVTGECVNLAKRIQQAARPGEILIGTATYPLVKDAVEAGPPQTFSVKGKAEPIAPRRLDAVDATAPGLARRFDAPLQGRQRELAALHEAFEEAARRRCARRVTLLGAAGIGKSRLAREFLARVRDAAETLTGRCLPYGEGITFWPLAQIVSEAGGERGLEDALACEAEAEVIRERIQSAIGLSAVEGGTQETFWAVRRFFECLAARRPLVVCFEDIHWAEPTFLDLIDYLTTRSRNVPILIICLARRDLLDARTTSTTPTAESTVVVLEPLSIDQAEALLEWLQGEAKLSPEVRHQIMDAADGNPLFVEQMAAMAAEEEEGSSPLRVPPSIQALLEERLDRLDSDEGSVIEHAAVIGKDFSRSALRELLPAPEREAAESRLFSLARKGLLQPGPSPAGTRDVLRFRHALIRDAAYDRVPKDLRAALHERLANLLERKQSDTPAELDEIIGYHLEQAVRYRQQLGPVDQGTRALAERAGELLGAAGRRAFTRDDMPAAIKLLDRAIALLTDQHPARLELLRELSSASWAVGELARAESLLDGLLQAATGSADRRVEWYTLLEREIRRNMTDPSPTGADLQEVAEGAIHVFEELGDNVGLARAWRSLAWAPRARGQFAIAERAVARALECSRRAGDRQEEARSVDVLCSTLLNGPTPAREGIRRCRELMERAAENRLMEASVATSLAGFLAMDGAFDEARMAARRAEMIYQDLGLQLPLLAWSEVIGFVELLADDPIAADRVLRRGYEMIARGGTSAVSAFQAGLLAVPVLAQRRCEEADRLATICEQASAADSIEAQVLWRRTRSLLHAHSGAFEQAIAVAKEAVERAAETDALNMRGDALLTLSSVLVDAGREEAAATAAAEALELYEQKGNIVAAERAAAQQAAVRS